MTVQFHWLRDISQAWISKPHISSNGLASVGGDMRKNSRLPLAQPEAARSRIPLHVFPSRHLHLPPRTFQRLFMHARHRSALLVIVEAVD